MAFLTGMYGCFVTVGRFGPGEWEGQNGVKMIGIWVDSLPDGLTISMSKFQLILKDWRHLDPAIEVAVVVVVVVVVAVLPKSTPPPQSGGKPTLSFSVKITWLGNRAA